MRRLKINEEPPSESGTRRKDIETLSDAAFKRELGETIPHLRAYSRSLAGSVDMADDLVQEAMLKAWNARDRFAAGTNMRAWTFTILRNVFLSQMRRAKFKGDWDENVADKILSTPASQDGKLHLGDVQRALMMLPDSQREALILVGAGGFSYEEAAEICGVAIGTIKSRVARGRAALEAIVEGDELDPRPDDAPEIADPMGEIMAEVDELAEGLEGKDRGA
ncbi:sigma-70 family RNA polymerase sigma factor [Sphingorhabdus sp. Alg239-R122]|uniref:sigma-70 family RNA polymerase sigma factor n=1 Tax=Sphingorhabdus sp. Alg239-R122 TaxID=2305989 RepID=UPI0013D9D9AF|nr:sigma-70 family RNA polymerase sigma factor [Sphingorhabdus sp. Alg239-R122]